MSLIRQLAGQTIIYGIGHVLSRVLYFLVLNFYLTYRFENTYEYGLYGGMYAYASILIVLLSYRMDTSFFRFGSSEGKLMETFSAAFFPIILSTIFLVSGIIFFADDISKILDYAAYPHYFKWFALIIGFDVLALLPFGKLRLENKAKQFMFFKVGNVLVSILLVLFFLEYYVPRNGLEGWIKIIFPSISHEVDFVFISNLIASFLLFLSLLFTLKGVKFRFNWPLFKKMFLYAFPLIIVGIANSVNQYFAPILQQFYLPEGGTIENIAESGIYRASFSIASLIVMFNTAFNYAAEPFFFRNKAKENDKEIYSKVLTLYVICAMLVTVGLIYYLDLIQYLIGRNYRDSLYIIPYLLLAFSMLGIYYNVSIWYKLSDKTIFGSLISIIGIGVTLVVSIIFLPKVGYLASAWAALACYSTMVVLALYFGSKYYPIAYDLKRVFLIIGTAILMILIGVGIDQILDPGFVKLSLKTMILLIYIWLLYKFNKSLILELKTSAP